MDHYFVTLIPSSSGYKRLRPGSLLFHVCSHFFPCTVPSCLLSCVHHRVAIVAKVQRRSPLTRVKAWCKDPSYDTVHRSTLTSGSSQHRGSVLYDPLLPLFDDVGARTLVVSRDVEAPAILRPHQRPTLHVRCCSPSSSSAPNSPAFAPFGRRDSATPSTPLSYRHQ